MIKRINIKLNVIEGMLYFWQATSEREKVGESYLNNIANLPEMSYLYNEEFGKESVRRSLSAISNREIFHSDTKPERVFWNNNMWMMEDLSYTHQMIAPLKILNLDTIVEGLNKMSNPRGFQELEVIFLPGHQQEYIISDNKLIINFFRVKPDIYGTGKVTIGEVGLEEYIEEKLKELL